MIGNRTQRSVFILVCVIAFTTLFGKAAHASSLPWQENSNSISRVLMLEDGQSTGLGGILDRIEGRNQSPYYVVRDPYLFRLDSSHSKIVVMGGCPAELVPGDAIFVEGTVQTLESGERCIGGEVTVYGFFDQRDRKFPWTPFFEILYNIYKRELAVDTGPILPSDPSMPADGTGILEPVTAYRDEGITKYDSVASLKASFPPIFTRVELTCRVIVRVGENYIIVGDNSADTASVVKVYTNDSSISQEDRIVTLRGTVHRESSGEIVVYAGGGPAPYLDIKGKDSGGSVLAARSGVAAAKSTSSESTTTNTQSSVMTVIPSSTPPQIGGGSVDLSGKVVTAVFFQPGTQTISSFYVQEPTIGGNGIKVVPQQPLSVPIRLGDTIRVAGTVIASSSTIPECYMDASLVELIGYRLMPEPVGMSQRSAASGVFGLQQALYSDTTVTPAVMGSGLSAVGSRIKIWGRVTWRSQGGTVCFVDDGSSLKSSYAGLVRTGIRVSGLRNVSLHTR